jgi:hypothetical protein
VFALTPGPSAETGEGDNSSTPAAPEETTFDPYTMWSSEPTSDGWASIEITFPFEVELSKVAVHSQHGGRYHAAEAVRIAAKTEGDFRDVVEKPLASAEDAVMFRPTKARTWRFHFKAGKSRIVVIRGLRFFSGEQEIFPALVPLDILHGCG